MNTTNLREIQIAESQTTQLRFIQLRHGQTVRHKAASLFIPLAAMALCRLDRVTIKYYSSFKSSTMQRLSATELKSQLSNFTGTCDWHKHQLTGFLYTDGVSYCAETFGMYWFLDIIFFENKHNLLDEFQVWKLLKNVENDSCVITADDGNDNILFTKKIEYTDFPSESIEFYFTNNVLLLPSEN